MVCSHAITLDSLLRHLPQDVKLGAKLEPGKPKKDHHFCLLSLRSYSLPDISYRLLSSNVYLLKYDFFKAKFGPLYENVLIPD